MKRTSATSFLLPNFLKIAFRNLRRQFGFAAINLSGLALGIAAAAIILLYVLFQLSFDDFHENADRIYRVKYDLFRDGVLATSASTTFAAVGPSATEEFPQVEEFVRTIQRFGGGVVRHENNFFQEKKVIHADPNFFTFFSYPVVRGNPETMLSEPNTAVLSLGAAERYFGDENPIGQNITFNGDEEYTVTGVVEVPENTHLGFDFIFSYSSLLQVWSDEIYSSWTWYDFRTYLRLTPDTTPGQVEAQFPNLIERHRETNSNERVVLELQPLTDIHLYSDLLFENQANGNATTVYALAVIGIFILLLAWINYINLSTAKATKRAKEIGVRKVLGAKRYQLITQFIFESLLLNIIAACLAILLMVFGLPFFNQFAGISLTFSSILNGQILLGFIGLFLCGTLLSSIYPAFVLSGFKPAVALKNKKSTGGFGNILRKGLVVIQFTASIGLIIGTLIIFRQLSFMQEQDLGVDIEQTIIVELPGNRSNNLANESFKQVVNQQSNFQHAAISSEVPGSGEQWINHAQWLRASDEDRIALYIIAVDHDYLNHHGPELLAGRLFSDDFSTDNQGLVLNEEAVDRLRMGTPERAVGEEVIVWQDTLTVVGVVENHHQMGLDQSMYQIGYRYFPDELRYLSIGMNTSTISASLISLENLYEQFFPNSPFNFRFAEHLFAEQYQKYRQFGRVLTLFTFLAIFIACLGLFGLAAFSAEQRTKEIGIRKVLGASVINLVGLLSKDFLKLIIIGFLITVPISWYAMYSWLSSFAYRIEIGIELFLISGVIALLVALLTISWQSINAALMNPVKSLRSGD